MKALLFALAFTPSLLFAQDEHVYQYQSINGNEIAFSCEGEGSPTIVLIAGLGLDAHASFNWTYHSYSGPGKICLYDRAGIGKSTFENPKTHTVLQLVGELYQLIEGQQWEDIIIVAHSFGGFVARAYIDTHSEKVTGALFLDVAEENWLPALKSRMSTTDYKIMEEILDWNIRNNHEDYYEAQEFVRTTQLPKQLPTTVVSRGLPQTQTRLRKMSYAGVNLFNQEHDLAQLRLLELTHDVEHRIAHIASHLVDSYDPWLIIEEIEKLIKRIH